MCDFVFSIKKDSVESISASTLSFRLCNAHIVDVKLLLSNSFLMWRWHCDSPLFTGEKMRYL